MSIGDFPESLTQAMLEGTMLVGRLGVFTRTLARRRALRAAERGSSQDSAEQDLSWGWL